MKRRVFIALDLPTGLKQQIAEAIKQWRWLPIRWLPSENWHITLIPPLYLDDPILDTLITTLRRGRGWKPLALRFSRVSLAPPGVPARMVWLEGATPPELPKLKKKLERIWASEPTLPQPKPESRPPHLHVTLARFESGELRELEAKTRMLGEVDFRFEAKEVAIMESHLTPQGATYQTLAAILLP